MPPTVTVNADSGESFGLHGLEHDEEVLGLVANGGYAVGAIQIPGGGQPIVLHCDAVSAGGYA